MSLQYYLLKHNGKDYSLRYNDKWYNLVSSVARFEVTPTPNDSTVLLASTAGAQSGNRIIVPLGSNISWTVERYGYVSQSGNVYNLLSNNSLSVSLTKQNFTYTISPTPVDATVTLTASGYSQVGNSITVPYGTTISWSVSKNGYNTKSGLEVVISNYTNVIDLEYATFTYTIVPVPVDSEVSMIAVGYPQVGNSITAPYGTSVSWTVSKQGYVSRTGIKSISATESETVNLNNVQYTYTIIPTPADATVTLTASGYSQVGNGISVSKGTIVSWTVSKVGYTTKVGTKTVYSTSNEYVYLVQS